MEIFEPASIGNIKLKNRIIRSATILKMCNKNGFPLDKYHKTYERLAQSEIGMIITGFTYISKKGRSMHSGQAGMDSKDKIVHFKKTTQMVHQYNCPIVMQLAHTGRQTKSNVTGSRVLGVSNQKSPYFNEIPRVVTTKEVDCIIDEFVHAACFAQQAGFDGIQLHAAHGYLIHQFILPSINNRVDRFGIQTDSEIGTGFLEESIDKIRQKCGNDYPILVKVSAGDDYKKTFTREQYINLLRFLDSKKVAAIEISYGTMDNALNIFRGKTVPYDTILEYNPKYKSDKRIMKVLWKKIAVACLLKKIKAFAPMYNLFCAILAKEYTDIPIICVGGFRKGYETVQAIKEKNINFISLSRPFICESDFVIKIKKDLNYISRCIDCNKCAIMVDSPYHVMCYNNRKGVIR